MISHFKNYAGFLFPVLFLLLEVGCKDNLVVDNSDQDFPLTLHLELGNDKVTLQWEAANISNFEKYVVVRSHDPIPAGLRPVNGSSTFEIIFQSDDIKSTEFVDATLPIVEKLYYKLYIGIGDRFVESPAELVTFDNLLVEGNGAVIKFIPDSNWVILGDEFSGILRVIDYNSKKTIASRSVQFANVDNMCLDVATENGKKVLYWWAGYNNFFKYSLPDLTQTNYWPVPFSGFSLLADDNLVYTTQYDFNQSFTPRRKTDMSILQSHYRTDYYTHRTLAFLDKSTHRLVEVSPYRILVYNIDTATGYASNTIEKNTSSFNIFYRDLPVSDNGQYFVAQYDGTVYDQNLNFAASIPFLNNGYIDLDFSPDGQFLYVAYQDFTFGNGALIQKFAFPSMQLASFRRFNNITPRNVEAIQDGIIFVGSGVNGFNQVLVKKLSF